MANKRQKVEKHNVLNDFVGACRVCMRKSDDLSSLFHTDCKTIEEIQYCTGILITENDNLPSSICHNCRTKLAIAHKFKTTCISSDDTFRVILEDIKIELNCEDSKNQDDIIVKEEDDELYTPDDDYDDIDEDLNDGTESVEEKGPKKPKVSKVRRKKGQGKFRKLYCTKCKVHFKNRQETLDHQQLLHKEDGHWVCEICGKQFTHYSSHYSHVRSHRPPQHACSLCDYRSSHKADLDKHLRVHTGEKTFQCHLCSGTFRTSSNLQGHIQRNHIGLKEHVCARCGKGFYSLNKLNRHLDSHNNIKRYECEVCHSCFTRRCYWKSHLQKKHDVITPPLRPGRRKTNVVIEELPDMFNK